MSLKHSKYFKDLIFACFFHQMPFQDRLQISILESGGGFCVHIGTLGNPSWCLLAFLFGNACATCCVGRISCAHVYRKSGSKQKVFCENGFIFRVSGMPAPLGELTFSQFSLESIRFSDSPSGGWRSIRKS